ncbi:hypothetical protein BJV77DRAFT_528668 [Russula vinacea]|nr:hypothetical protein BJV77DRAFT_528668 [Russula vinacea]
MRSFVMLRDVESMRAITCAHQTPDLAAESMVRNYRDELSSTPTSDRTSLPTFCASLSHIRPLDTLHKQSILPILLAPALFGLTFPDIGRPRCPKWPNPFQRARSRRGTRRSPTQRDCHYLTDKIDVSVNTPPAGCITVGCERGDCGDGLARIPSKSESDNPFHPHQG